MGGFYWLGNIPEGQYYDDQKKEVNDHMLESFRIIELFSMELKLSINWL